MIRAIRRAIAAAWNWLAEPFREELLDVPTGLEDIHELSGGTLYVPRPPGMEAFELEHSDDEDRESDARR